jgi:gluconate kinase
MRQKEHFEEQKILSSNERRKKRSCQHCWSEKDMRKVPKRLRTGDEHFVEALKVKVEFDDDDDKEEEEESLDNDNNEEKEDKIQEEQVAQPV